MEYLQCKKLYITEILFENFKILKSDLSVEEVGEHGKGLNWLVSWNHVPCSLQKVQYLSYNMSHII